MNNPDKDLLNLLKDHWSLSDKGLKKKDIPFTQVGYRTDKGLQDTPNIWVRRMSMRRLAENEEFFEYRAAVHTVFWCKSLDVEKVQADKDKKWKMIEHIKKLVHNSTYWPSNWDHAQVDGEIVRNVEPQQVLEDEVIIRINLFWEPS